MDAKRHEKRDFEKEFGFFHLHRPIPKQGRGYHIQFDLQPNQHHLQFRELYALI